MTTSVRNKVKLPTWLREVIDEGEPTDNLINKREEPRIVARLLINAQRINAQRDDHSNANPFPVRLWDVSTKGMSFVARIPLDPGDRLKLTPDDDWEQSVHVSVVHCTQKIQGYMIGCIIVSA